MNFYKDDHNNVLGPSYQKQCANDKLTKQQGGMLVLALNFKLKSLYFFFW